MGEVQRDARTGSHAWVFACMALPGCQERPVPRVRVHAGCRCVETWGGACRLATWAPRAGRIYDDSGLPGSHIVWATGASILRAYDMRACQEPRWTWDDAQHRMHSTLSGLHTPTKLNAFTALCRARWPCVLSARCRRTKCRRSLDLPCILWESSSFQRVRVTPGSKATTSGWFGRNSARGGRAGPLPQDVPRRL